MRQLTKRSTAIAATTVVALAPRRGLAAWTLTGSGNAEAKAGSSCAEGLQRRAGTWRADRGTHHGPAEPCRTRQVPVRITSIGS